MPETSGSFGVVGPRYSIGDTKVVLQRRWAPLALGLGLPIGVWMAVHGFHGHGDRSGEIGILLVVVGIVGILASPLRPPARIEVTSGLIVVGGKRYTKDEVGVIVEIRTTQASPFLTRVVFHEWRVRLTMLDMKSFDVRLRRGGLEAPADVEQLVAAMRTVFAS